MLSPASNGVFEFSFRFHFSSSCGEVSASLSRAGHARARNLGGKYVSKIRGGRGSTEEREGISNFPVWVGPLPR